jgi:anti-sigma factor RsiW
MTGEQLRELINRDVDGDLSPSERRELTGALRRNASARKLHAEIKALGTALSSVRQVEPPANLGNRIRADIRSRIRAPHPRRTWVESFRALLETPSVLRYGTVFTGGLVTGALLFMFLIHPQPVANVSGDVATGTLLSHSEIFPVDVTGAKGTLTAIATETGKELTFRLTCGTSTTTKLTYDPSRVKLENVREVQSAGGPVVVNAGIVEMTGTGSQKCTLVFSGVRDSRIAVQVAAAGGGTFNKEIQVH